MRLIGVVLAMVAVLALAVLGLGAGGPSGAPSSASSGATSLPSTAGGQFSPAGYGGAIQAAQNAVQASSHDAAAAASTGP